MTQEDKQLLLIDLSGRLPYGVKGYLSGLDVRIEILGVNGNDIFCKPLWHRQELIRDIRYVKPYLRPLSSMTEEEKEELLNHVIGGEGVEYFHIAHDGSIDGNQEAEQDLYNLNLHWLNFGPLTTASYIDWLNKKMFDYRGFIPKGLAISTEEFNPYK